MATKTPFTRPNPITPAPLRQTPQQKPDFGGDPRNVPTGRPTPSGPTIPPAVK